MQPSKATIKNLENNDVIKVKFNPTEYSIQKENQWTPKQVVGRNIPRLEFSGGGSRVMNMELLLDCYEEEGKDLSADITKLWNLTMISEQPKNRVTRRSRPPMVLFQWGGQWSFKAVVTSMNVRCTLFRENGTPVRATVTVTFQECEDATVQRRQNPTSGSEPGYKRRELRMRDSLQTIAFEEYGDSSLWRAIATANGIDDPTALVPGQIIAIPPPHRVR